MRKSRSCGAHWAIQNATGWAVSTKLSVPFLLDVIQKDFPVSQRSFDMFIIIFNMRCSDALSYYEFYSKMVYIRRLVPPAGSEEGIAIAASRDEYLTRTMSFKQLGSMWHLIVPWSLKKSYLTLSKNYGNLAKIHYIAKSGVDPSASHVYLIYL